MGLDMYLKARHFFWEEKDIPKVDVVPDGYRMTYLYVNAFSWRKANAIHQWFVDNVQDGVDDCRSTYVAREMIQKLVNICDLILGEVAKPEDLLPTQEGFFFGSTQYDDWYFENLRETSKGLKKVLEDFLEDKWDFEYQSSW